jgi:hypothetical protein
LDKLIVGPSKRTPASSSADGTKASSSSPITQLPRVQLAAMLRRDPSDPTKLGRVSGEGGAGGGSSTGSGSGTVGAPNSTGSGPQPTITKPYSRPSNATTPEQRASVQGQPCVDCNAAKPKMHANHIDPLVEEYYREGEIDQSRMRSPGAVNSQCPTCSNRQGGFLSNYSRRMKQRLGV